jgi:hypothetical protein
VASQIDRALFEKAIDVTAMALRGSMGGENSQPPAYAAQVFREVWNALREAAEEIQEKPKAGF